MAGVIGDEYGEHQRRTTESSLSRHDLISEENPGKGLLTRDDWERVGELLELSERELGVAVLLFEGRSRDSIARRLRKPNGQPLSPGTVRVYLDRLFAKANVSDRLEFVLRVIRVHGVIRNWETDG